MYRHSWTRGDKYYPICVENKIFQDLCDFLADLEERKSPMTKANYVFNASMCRVASDSAQPFELDQSTGKGCADGPQAGKWRPLRFYHYLHVTGKRFYICFIYNETMSPAVRFTYWPNTLNPRRFRRDVVNMFNKSGFRGIWVSIANTLITPFFQLEYGIVDFKQSRHIFPGARLELPMFVTNYSILIEPVGSCETGIKMLKCILPVESAIHPNFIIKMRWFINGRQPRNEDVDRKGNTLSINISKQGTYRCVVNARFFTFDLSSSYDEVSNRSTIRITDDCIEGTGDTLTKFLIHLMIALLVTVFFALSVLLGVTLVFKKQIFFSVLQTKSKSKSRLPDDTLSLAPVVESSPSPNSRSKASDGRSKSSRPSSTTQRISKTSTFPRLQKSALSDDGMKSRPASGTGSGTGLKKSAPVKKN